MQHRGNDPVNPGWTRSYNYFEPSLLEPGKRSNRLTSTTVGGATETYSTGGNGYDAHGNMLRMPQLQIMQWDFQDQLQMTQRQAMNVDDEDGMQHQGERTWYVYDAGGQRVRKVTELATGQVKDERIYLGGFEIYRRHGANSLVRETLHIMDDKQRIALVETRTHGNEPGVPVQLIRYQFANHLGSASLELDDRRRSFPTKNTLPTAARLIKRCGARPRRQSVIDIREWSGMRKVDCPTTKQGITRRGSRNGYPATQQEVARRKVSTNTVRVIQSDSSIPMGKIKLEVCSGTSVGT